MHDPITENRLNKLSNYIDGKMSEIKTPVGELFSQDELDFLMLHFNLIAKEVGEESPVGTASRWLQTKVLVSCANFQKKYEEEVGEDFKTELFSDEFEASIGLWVDKAEKAMKDYVDSGKPTLVGDELIKYINDVTPTGEEMEEDVKKRRKKRYNLKRPLPVVATEKESIRQ